MANDLDLIRTSATNELLDRMAQELPGLNIAKYATDMVAALLWIDEATGHNDEGNYILLNPDIGEALMYEADIADSRMGKQWGKMCVYGIVQDATEFLQMANTPFNVEFPLSDDVPANIRGKKVAVAIMSRQESEQEPFVDYEAVTMNHDHTIVGDTTILRRAA